jgi:hypothetical protein
MPQEKSFRDQLAEAMMEALQIANDNPQDSWDSPNDRASTLKPSALVKRATSDEGEQMVERGHGDPHR